MSSNNKSLWNDTSQSFLLSTFPGTDGKRPCHHQLILEDDQYWKASLEKALVGRRNITENQTLLNPRHVPAKVGEGNLHLVA